eukprot:m.20198 g.20198  ORF g.20198 m.20198 type:complete len:110 (+) comp5548_c0_seq1:117-446(+)
MKLVRMMATVAVLLLSFAQQVASEAEVATTAPQDTSTSVPSSRSLSALHMQVDVSNVSTLSLAIGVGLTVVALIGTMIYLAVRRSSGLRHFSIVDNAGTDVDEMSVLIA